MSIDLLLLLIALLLMLISIASLVDWWRERQQQPPLVSTQRLEWLRQWWHRSRITPPNINPSEKVAPVVAPPTPPRATSQLADLNRRLLTVLQGNGEIAQSLLDHCRQKFPNRDLVWYYEKVLDDLERDRR